MFQIFSVQIYWKLISEDIYCKTSKGFHIVSTRIFPWICICIFVRKKLDLLPDYDFLSHAIFHICYILKSINVKCMFTNQFLENFFTINWKTCIRLAKNNLCDFKLYAPVPAFRKPFICVFTTNCVYTCTLTSLRLFSFFS